MHSSAVDLFQILVQLGAIPGEDFSCDATQQAFRLNERCYQLLMDAYPEINWQDVFESQANDLDPLIHTLTEQLGVPFVDNLLSAIPNRLRQLTDAQGASYLQQILVGVEERTGLPLLPLLEARLDLSTQVHVEWLLRQTDLVPCYAWIEDLVLAAGGSPEDITLNHEGIWLTQSGIQLLKSVWVGHCEVSLSLPHQQG